MRKLMVFMAALLVCVGMAGQVITVKDTVDIEARNLNVQPMLGYVFITAANSTYSIDFQTYDPSEEATAIGHYTLDELTEGCIMENMSSGAQIILQDASFDVALNDKASFVITGYLIGKEGSDTRYYRLNLRLQLPDPTREMLITLDGLTFYDASEKDGVWQAYGKSKNERQYISIAMYASSIDGDYEQDELYSNYCVYYELSADLKDTIYYGFADTHVHVKKEGEQVRLTGHILCINTSDDDDIPRFTIDLTCTTLLEEESEHLQYDEKDLSTQMSFHASEVKINLSEIEEKGIVYVDASSKKEEAHLLFYVASFDKSMGLQEGTYFINDSEKTGTVFASQGPDEHGKLTYSCALTYEGKYIDKVWWLVDGIARVTRNSDRFLIEVQAENSYGKEVILTISGYTEDIEDIQMPQKPIKQLKDGEIFILCGEKKYNLLGLSQE